MNTMIKKLTAGIAISLITGGVAFAMIPSNDLNVNRFADEGLSTRVLSDIDSGLLQLRDKAPNRGISELKTAPDSAALDFEQLNGKHMI